MIVSVLDRSAGFYSGIFFMLNHYIHCKENRITFVLDTMEWLFKYDAGWEDYFENIDLLFDAATDNEPTTSRSAGVMQFFRHSQIIEDFRIAKYRAAIRKIYCYNTATRDYIAHVAATQLAELGDTYDAVFIRRGDKLYDESAFIPTVEYFKVLMKTRLHFAGAPLRNIILQTDDYNCVIEAQEYINGYNAGAGIEFSQPVQLFTLCRRENTGGMIIFPRNLNDTIKYNASASYVAENIAEYAKRRSVYEYTPPEIYEHTLEMIAGVDFVLRSRICVLDLQSNVSRFIRLMRDDDDEPYTTTLDIAQLETDPQDHDRCRNFPADNMLCPAFVSSIYPDNFVVANIQTKN